MCKELLNMIRKLNESYSDIWSDNAWDAYDIALEYLGADGLCEALAKAMGTDALADNLKYIFRTNEIPFDEDDDEDENFDESCGRKSKKRKCKKSVKESFENTLYCVAGFDASEYQGYGGKDLTLVAFSTLGDAESFEAMVIDHPVRAEYEDELDPEFFDVTGGYIDDYDDFLYDNGCVGCYVVSIQDVANARNYDTDIIPGKEVVILNQSDIYDHDLLYFENIPDRYYR